jgi:hypothetical protein
MSLPVDVGSCEGLRTPAGREVAGSTEGRRPKASREGTRGADANSVVYADWVIADGRMRM